MPLVMLVDDDKEPMQYYVMALKQEGFDVKQMPGPDEAMEYVCGENNARPDMIILDIMMSPGTRYKGNPDCDDGLRTGILLYPELKEAYPSVPLLVLTNLKKASDDLKEIAPEIKVLQKIDTAPFDLVSHVNKIIHGETG